MSRGKFGDSCVHMAKERLCSQGENASKRQDVCRGEYLAIIAYIWRKRDYGRRGKMRQCVRIGEFNRDCVL